MELSNSSVSERKSTLPDVVKINLIIWGALITALGIILWETTFLTQAVPVAFLAAIASNLFLLWGARGMRDEAQD
ncbi:hypothetical protein [Haladaptatus sp. DFWS20]|uniref:hypothetical protein n=1 Tax=Haladaptatus sp. DFWS20 TaxID=3403467 RepID=UPI003EB76D7A